jgi:hypothetical protein
MSVWEKLLDRPSPRGHYVQLYEADELALAENVGRYLWEGLRRGDGVWVIATPEHQDLFCRRLNCLGADVAAAVGNRQLVFRDAQETLGHFMDGGQPDWHMFQHTINRAMQQVSGGNIFNAGLRTYGEMVGILWKARQFAAAIRLEQFWNKLLEQSSFRLYCAYAIDVFGEEFQVANLEPVLCTHTHLIPAQPNGKLETALNLAVDEILGDRAQALRIQFKENLRPSWAVMPNAEAIVLWLRNHIPGQAEQIVARARHHYHSLQLAGFSPTVE